MKTILSLSNLKNITVRTMVVASLSVASASYMEPARSIPVFDAANFGQNAQTLSENFARWAETVAHYGKEIAHYKDVMDHYTKQIAFWNEQLNNLRSFNFTLFQYQQTFTSIPKNYGVDVLCPGSSSGSLVDKVTSSLTSFIDTESDIVSQQQGICAKIVLTQNSKYNDTVEYLNSLLKQTKSLEEITASRINDIGKSPGNTEGLLQETQRFSATFQMSKENWETRMQQYDIQIELLKHQQMILAKQAMNGKPTIWGTLVNTAVLQGALKLNK